MAGTRERLGQLVVELAAGLKIRWEDAGSATFRSACEERRCRGRQDVLFRRERAAMMKGSAGHRSRRPAAPGPGDRGRGVPFRRRRGRSSGAGSASRRSGDSTRSPMECSFWSRRADGDLRPRSMRSLAVPRRSPRATSTRADATGRRAGLRRNGTPALGRVGPRRSIVPRLDVGKRSDRASRTLVSRNYYHQGAIDEHQPSQHVPQAAQRDVARRGRQGEPGRRADHRPARRCST